MSRRASVVCAALGLIALGGLELAGAHVLRQAAAQSSAPILAQSPTGAAPQCAPTNVACRCSFQCCGEERCDGSICNQCVIDCVQRQQVVDSRSTALRSRCQSLMTRGFKRL